MRGARPLRARLGSEPVAVAFTYRLRIPHRSGSLERVSGASARAGGLIGDVETIKIASPSTISA